MRREATREPEVSPFPLLVMAKATSATAVWSSMTPPEFGLSVAAISTTEPKAKILRMVAASEWNAATSGGSKRWRMGWCRTTLLSAKFEQICSPRRWR